MMRDQQSGLHGYSVREVGIQVWMVEEPDLYHDKLRVTRRRNVRAVRAAIRVLLS